MAVEATEKQIIKQIEYYFGDINLSRDKFLLEQVAVNDGWVALETMIKFNRLAQITTDFSEICSALKKSDSGLMEVSEDEKKIRRSPHVPLPEMNEGRRKELQARSAYVRRFPANYKMADVLLWCSNHARDYEHVTMRYYYDGAEKVWRFKGSVYVTFKTIDECKKFVEGEALELNGNAIVKMWQDDYHEETRMENIEHKKKKKEDKKRRTEDMNKKKEKNRRKYLKKMKKLVEFAPRIFSPPRDVLPNCNNFSIL